MSVVTSTDISNGLIATFAPARLDAVIHTEKHRPLLKRIRTKSFVGEDYKVSVYASHRGNVSSTFTDAQAMSTAPYVGRFNAGATLSELHNSFQIKTQALARSQGGNRAGVIADAISNGKNVIWSMADELERMMVCGSAFQRIGVVDMADVGSTTLELATATDARWFKKGMRIVASATDGGALRTGSGDGYCTVTSDGDPIAGTVELTADLDVGITDVVTADSLYIKGSDANNATQIKSLAAWATTPTASEDFLGQDRSLARTQLAMLTTTGSTSDFTAGLIKADALAGELNGGMRTLALMNAYDFGLLRTEMEDSVQRVPGTKTSISYSYIGMSGNNGQDIEIVGSPYVDRNTVFLLNLQSWELVHLLAKPVGFDSLDGKIVKHLASNSGYEFRGYGAVQLVSNSPGSNVKVTYS